MKRKQMTKTTMYRKTVCTNCNYTQEDSVSYYLHAKAWNKGHDLAKCGELRKQKSLNAFVAMFDNAEDALASLSIIK
jgi:hypothetical protein